MFASEMFFDAWVVAGLLLDSLLRRVFGDGQLAAEFAVDLECQRHGVGDEIFFVINWPLALVDRRIVTELMP